MALDLTTEQKEVGRKNFEAVAGDLTRRDMMKSMAAGAAVVPLSAAVYYGYESWKGNKAVKTALLGCGDEGGVLIGDHNPEFINIVAVADIRPSNQERIFEGEKAGPRKGLKHYYGKNAKDTIKTFGNYEELLKPEVIKDLGIEAVIIALPLHLHDVATIKCMDAGLHVLCEKLMARDITRCKNMIKKAKETGCILSVGHQRHYSMLYAHALEVVNSGVLGEIKHIRALWHRNNSWPLSYTSEDAKEWYTGKDVDGTECDIPFYRDGWCKPIPNEDAKPFLDDPASLKAAEYENIKELIRWRLYDRTGGGLMAELGSHQLDAASIFLGKVHPLAVQGVGGKFFYGPGRNDRESDDHVFVTFEFPGPNHPKGANHGTDEKDIVVVTYSSVNTNSFESYGECLMGSRGTMIVEEEREVYLFKENQPGKSDSGGKDMGVSVTSLKGGTVAMEASSTWGAGGSAVVKQANAPRWDTNVRGYRSEMEHFAFCVRKWDKKKGYEMDKDGKYVQEMPRCHGEIAMADAILALTANMAMDKQVRIPFKMEWFDADNPAVPETEYGKGERV